jgi:1-aminocyclopropane-1-carboxylate deaminase/D-cysteine desulfhydrase-like pyridoxal-dependent ACC family enzyme
MLALFGAYPSLRERLPYVALGDFPTPVERLERLGQAINTPRLYVKRDDLSGKVYGGNKVRALEFLLGEALRTKTKEVIALGFPASCQALAQAVYARQVGLRSIAFLFPQVVSKQARQHLLIYQSLSAEVRPILHLFPYAARHWVGHGRLPMLLEASTPLGVMGYVSAAFELKHQIAQGQLPEPHQVYVALATMGTAVGLMLGFKATGLKCQVIGIDNGGRILGRKIATPGNMARLFRETNALLRSHNPGFPEIPVSEADFIIQPGYLRGQKTLLNPAGAQAMVHARELANLQLDEMFTANAFAALLADGEAGALRDKTVLWWNSYNSRDFSSQIASADFRQLPKDFHHYFENGSP